ncbi:MAG: hypothetical protein N2C14_23400, partial [Planctomycetales bacterium]
KSAWLQQFVHSFGTEENNEASTFNGAIPQSLMMMNGDLMRQATVAEKGTFLHRVAYHHQWNDRVKIKHLYLAALGRQPTRGEMRQTEQAQRSRTGETVAVLEDVWWALLNSNEFIINH